MKKLLFLAIAFSATGLCAHAQQTTNYEQIDRYAYPTGYYAPIIWGSGTNGFATIDEENREMYEAIAAKRREEARENGRPEPRPVVYRKQDEQVTASSKRPAAAKKEPAKTKR